MLNNSTTRLFGPVIVLSTSGTLDLFAKENGLVDFSVILAAILPRNETSPFTFLTTTTAPRAARIQPFSDLITDPSSDGDLFYLPYLGDADKVRYDLQKILSKERDISAVESTPHLSSFKLLELRSTRVVEHEYFNRPIAVLVAVSSNDFDPVLTASNLLESTIEILKEKYRMDPNLLTIFIVIFELPSGKHTNRGSTSTIMTKLRSTFDLAHIHTLTLDAGQNVTDCKSDVGPLTTKVYTYNKFASSLKGYHSSIGKDEGASQIFIPSEEALDKVEYFMQKILLPSVTKNLETIAYQKCPEFSASSTWQATFLQRARLKYLKTSKLADFFSNEKRNTNMDEAQKLNRSVKMLKELADLVFMLGNFGTAHRLYDMLYERLRKESTFPLYLAGTEEMLGLCTLALDRDDKVRVALDHLEHCLGLYNSMNLPQLLSSSLLRYYEVFKDTPYENRLYGVAARAYIDCKCDTMPMSYGFILERSFWWTYFSRKETSLFKSNLYAYLAAECYYRGSMYYLAYRCYNICLLVMRSRDYPQIFSEVYRRLGNCSFNLGTYGEAIENYIQASKLDYSNYHILLSDYTLALDKAISEGLYQPDDVTPRFAAPRILEDTVDVKMFPLNNFESSEGFIIRKAASSKVNGTSGIVQKLSCGLDDAIIVNFDIYNTLGISINLSEFKLIAVFVEIDGTERPFEHLKVGDISLAPTEVKSCSTKGIFNNPGRLVISGYSFMIDRAKFSRRWSENVNSEFINSGASINVGNDLGGLRVSFENTSMAPIYGEVREISATMHNASSEDIVVDSVTATGNIFFLRDGVAKQTILGCCLEKNCPEHRDVPINEIDSRCQCNHKVYTVSNDIFSYTCGPNKNSNLVKVGSQSSICIVFNIWINQLDIQGNKISFNYGHTSAESSIESIDYEIFINSKCTPSLNVLFEPEMVDLDYRIIELMLNQDAMKNFSLKLVLFSPSYVLCRDFNKRSELCGENSSFYKIVKHQDSNEVCAEAITWKSTLSYVLLNKTPSLHHTLVDILSSSMLLSGGADEHHLDDRSLLSITIHDMIAKMKNYSQCEAYKWFSDDIVDFALKLVYKKDIILLVVWVDPVLKRRGIYKYIDDSSSSHVTRNMFSYFFKRISDMKLHSEDERLNDVILTKSQKNLAQQFRLHIKNMDWALISVNVSADTKISHSFKDGDCIFRVYVNIENFYLEDSISFVFMIDAPRMRKSLGDRRSFNWVGCSSISGKLKPYQNDRRMFTATFCSPGIYDINNWILYIYPSIYYKYPNGDHIFINPDKIYIQVPTHPYLVTIEDSGK